MWTSETEIWINVSQNKHVLKKCFQRFLKNCFVLYHNDCYCNNKISFLSYLLLCSCLYLLFCSCLLKKYLFFSDCIGLQIIVYISLALAAMGYIHSTVHCTKFPFLWFYCFKYLTCKELTAITSKFRLLSCIFLVLNRACMWVNIWNVLSPDIFCNMLEKYCQNYMSQFYILAWKHDKLYLIETFFSAVREISHSLVICDQCTLLFVSWCMCSDLRPMHFTFRFLVYVHHISL